MLWFTVTTKGVAKKYFWSAHCPPVVSAKLAWKWRAAWRLTLQAPHVSATGSSCGEWHPFFPARRPQLF